MAELRPQPLRALVGRLLRELEERDGAYDLPARRFWNGPGERDLSVAFHGARAGTPFGPAAGPQSQMAQNLVLSWLGGARVVELKTVQVDDRLTIPRPCIDLRTVGFNVEWSQELRLEQSLEEYVKGALLVEVLRASGLCPQGAAEGPAAATIWDTSVGYDLAGIRDGRVQAFLDGLQDCRAVVDRLRPELPPRFRDVEVPARLSGTVTLSTFHGCPPDEIERIALHLLEERGLHTIVKLNPMLLGPAETRRLLHDVLGYRDLRVPDSAFERDTTWDQAVGFVERLERRARELGLGFGVKLTNTLIVENPGDFLPGTAPERYLSGPPLHVLAMALVGRVRETFGPRVPISFSAGVDRRNFADAAALGLVPITVCSDLLRPGGYGRASGYLDELSARLDAAGARDLESFAIRSHGNGAAALARTGLAPGDPRRAACERALADGGDLRSAAGDELWPRWVAAAQVRNTSDVVAAVLADPRYAAERNARPPRKIGSRLELLDCIACDKCVPACPNDANFAFAPPPVELPVLLARRGPEGWSVRRAGELVARAERQYANYADFCNDCGNCDVFCPEDGGPYVVKPRFFGSLAAWREAAPLDGLFLERTERGERLHARLAGRELQVEPRPGGRARFAGPGFELELDPDEPAGTLVGEADGEVDLTPLLLLRWIRAHAYRPDAHNPASALFHASIG